VRDRRYVKQQVRRAAECRVHEHRILDGAPRENSVKWDVERVQSNERHRRSLAELQPDAHFISATTGDGVEPLLSRLSALLPDSAFLYPDDEISTQTVRFFASELVRETALEQLDDEVPYSVACEIEEFRESQSPVYIRAVLHVERDSQKQILIGAGGQRVRAIGQTARQKIEAFLGSRVYLDLWVKVLPNWRRNTHALQRFGYSLPEDRSP